MVDIFDLVRQLNPQSSASSYASTPSYSSQPTASPGYAYQTTYPVVTGYNMDTMQPIYGNDTWTSSVIAQQGDYPGYTRVTPAVGYDENYRTNFGANDPVLTHDWSYNAPGDIFSQWVQDPYSSPVLPNGMSINQYGEQYLPAVGAPALSPYAPILASNIAAYGGAPSPRAGQMAVPSSLGVAGQQYAQQTGVQEDISTYLDPANPNYWSTPGIALRLGVSPGQYLSQLNQNTSLGQQFANVVGQYAPERAWLRELGQPVPPINSWAYGALNFGGRNNDWSTQLSPSLAASFKIPNTPWYANQPRAQKQIEQEIRAPSSWLSWA